MTDHNKQEQKIVLVQGKLMKIVHEEGSGQFPQKGQEVSAIYRGTLENGEQFDRYQNREIPFKFVLGEGNVIKGWEEGFASMKVGEKATLICSSEYGYGVSGFPPRIPSNATLYFEVQLLEINERKKQKWQLSTKQKVLQATKLKNQGNQHLKNNQPHKALLKYNDAIQYVESQQNQPARAILKILRMNASQAYLKTNQPHKTIQLCDKILKIDTKNIKTLYRRAVAYNNIHEFQLAKDDLEVILGNQPGNQEARCQLRRGGELRRIREERERSFLKGMFSKSGLYDDVKLGHRNIKQEEASQSQNEQLQYENQQQHPQQQSTIKGKKKT